MANENPSILVLCKIRIREFPFYAERESENSRFEENENPRVFGKREFSFCGKPESENSLFFGKSESENLWKKRIRDSRFVENENSHFVENVNP